MMREILSLKVALSTITESRKKEKYYYLLKCTKYIIICITQNNNFD